MTSIVVAALYRFVHLPDFRDLQKPLLDFCQENQLRGTLLLAEEGINGTLAGTRQNVDAVLAHLRLDQRFADLQHKESLADAQPFYRMKVKLKKEIVTLGVPNTDPNNTVGVYLNVEQWNEMLADPDVLVIDTRNQYEIDIGSFKNAVSPNTESFREFPKFVEKELSDKKDKKIAMFCTGGIRCEKATSYLKSQGFNQVFHLQGGILKYLETADEKQNLWDGECFVFDGRVSVDKALNKGSYDQCYACRRPISDKEKQSQHYVKGISCPHCINEYTDKQKKAFSERQKQVALAKARGEQHIGLAAPTKTE